MPALEGGAALPVTTGGQGQTEARAAVPVYVVPGGPVIGQRARRVVVVTSGPIEGGAARPVYDAGPTALYSAEAALPIYIVSGPNLYPLAYSSKVNALSPIAYWPLGEPSGSVALDESGNGRHGAYTAVTLGAAGIGDGRTAAGFDGTTSFCNVYSASLAGAFNGQEGTIALWLRMVAGTWTDSVARRAVSFFADASNLIHIRRDVPNNQLAASYVAGGVTKSVNSTILGGTTVWFHAAITWSKSADQFKFYLNGAQIGATVTGLGTWAGGLSSTQSLLGALNMAPSVPWLGLEAHAALFASALTPAQILALATL